MMLVAMQDAHHTFIDDSEIIVDYSRQQLMPGWIPRRLGQLNLFLSLFTTIVDKTKNQTCIIIFFFFFWFLFPQGEALVAGRSLDSFGLVDEKGHFELLCMCHLPFLFVFCCIKLLDWFMLSLLTDDYALSTFKYFGRTLLLCKCFVLYIYLGAWVRGIEWNRPIGEH